MSRRKPTGAQAPIIAALINSLPQAGSVWPYSERQAWLSATQAAFNLIYTAETPYEQTIRHVHQRIHDSGVAAPDYVPPPGSGVALPGGGVALSTDGDD